MLHVMVATATAWVLIALAAALVFIVTAAAARAQGRRLERRMVAELGRRWDQQRMVDVPVGATSNGSGTDDGVQGAGGEGSGAEAVDADLQITLEDLLSQRDVLLEEFQAVQAQIRVLKLRVDRRRQIAPVQEDDEDTDVIRLNDVLPEEWAERRRR